MLGDEAADLLAAAVADEDLVFAAAELRPFGIEDVAQLPDVRTGDLHPAAAGAAGHDLLQRALRDRLAAGDHHDVVGRLADLGEHVAGDEDRAALRGEAPEEVTQPADAVRVQAVARLV